MWLHLLLSSFLSLILWLPSQVCSQETQWEVASVFLGNQEDQAFQMDIDQNILELAQVSNPNIKLGLYRESAGQNYSYYPEDKNNHGHNLSDLLYRKDLKHIAIKGKIIKREGAHLEHFLNSFYKNAKSKKALFIYAHGLGPLGLKTLPTLELKRILKKLNESIRGPIDFIWFDACYMANLEFLFELRAYSKLTIASQESEFSAGLPFENLFMLTKFSNPSEAAQALAQGFIESYSYIKKGRQRQSVVSSSATISVVDNSALELFSKKLKLISNYFYLLTPEDKNKLQSMLFKKSTMEDLSLVDLGQLLISFRSANQDPLLDQLMTSMIRELNIDSVKSLRSNPRIKISPPSQDAQLVYGFNNWTHGHKEDNASNPIFNQILSPDGFTLGPLNKNWPIKKALPKKLTLSPFAPNLNRFDYYFISPDGKVLASTESATRTHDIVEVYRKSATSPIVYSAYTQRLSSLAERYTGINIAMPGLIPSLDYFEMEFNQLAQWLKL